ncbi:MAG: CDP-diacylglycerol--serine O-phosphatidyltransferase [Bacillota bacterium]|jgi:CDP-diacylglycerol--serine O-phosphatidyltransferase
MGISIIPSIFTLANLIFGVLSLYYTMLDKFLLASIMILICMVMDGLDGRIARKLDVSSSFGKELDSLADLVSFGVAPALLIFSQILFPFEWIGLFTVIWFIVAGALRLARFNVIETTGYFLGMPITAAGSLLALLSLMSGKMMPFVYLVLVIMLGLLMVSNIKMPKY